LRLLFGLTDRFDATPLVRAGGRFVGGDWRGRVGRFGYVLVIRRGGCFDRLGIFGHRGAEIRAVGRELFALVLERLGLAVEEVGRAAAFGFKGVALLLELAAGGGEFETIFFELRRALVDPNLVLIARPSEVGMMLVDLGLTGLELGQLRCELRLALGQLPVELDAGGDGLLVLGGLELKLFVAGFQFGGAAGKFVVGGLALGLPGLALLVKIGALGRQRGLLFGRGLLRFLAFSPIFRAAFLEGGPLLVEFFAALVELGERFVEPLSPLVQLLLRGLVLAPQALELAARLVQLGFGPRQGGLALGKRGGAGV
jgi:hypothetical protein